MMNQVLTVYIKELTDALRDRRSVMAAMSYAFIGPMVMALAFFMMVQESTSEADIYVTYQGAEYAPELVDFLAEQGVIAATEASHKASAKLTIQPDYQSRLASGKSNKVSLRADFSNRKDMAKLQRIEKSIQAYNQILSSTRLTLRGISQEVMYAVVAEKQDTATRESYTGMIMGSVMVFVLMAIFFSGMNVAIDTSAGERERNALEFLLAQPVRTFDLVFGKSLAAATFSIAGGVLTLVMIPLVFIFIPLEKIGMDLSFSWQSQFVLAWVLLPMALFASSLQLLVSFMAKSFKEAQTYISFVMFAPMTVVFVLEFSRFEHVLLPYMPVTSQHQALLGSINGEPVAWFALLIGAVSTLVLYALLLFGVTWKLRSEKTVFGL